MFFHKKEPHFDWVLDNELWGTYGDFVGGVLGTIFTTITVLLMVKTFTQQRQDYSDNDKNQKKITQATRKFYAKQNKDNNDSQEKLNEAIRFNSLFFELLKLYQQQVSLLNIEESKTSGKRCFDIWMDILLNGMNIGIGEDKYQKQIVDLYMKLYIENRTDISSFFRTLYRIFDTIESSKIEEQKKVEYAKIVRAQLSENEMLLLRYNAICYYGENFRRYINEYNLLKHVPIMSLLEFTYWSKVINQKENTGLNMVFNDTTKFLFDRYKNKTDLNEHKYVDDNNTRYNLKTSYPTPYRIDLALERQSNIMNMYNEFAAFEKYSVSDALRLLKRFLEYIVFYANFGVFNDIDDLKIEGDSITDGDTNIYKASVYSISGKSKIQLTFNHKKRQV